jgi:hypothetical protein
MRKNIAFAYFIDGVFGGWYSNSFGTVSPSSPKIYGDSQEQIDIITKNFQHKIKKINTTTFEEEKNKITGGIAVFGLLSFTNAEELKGKEIELRIVDCPIYDGPNPDFNKAVYDRLVEAEKEQMTKDGIFDIPAPSMARYEAVQDFYKRNGRIKHDSWIYPDYEEVKKWASVAPTEFIKVIKYDK